MDCKDIRELLYEFATNRLGNQDFQLVEGHLKKCSVCQVELKELKETLLLLNEWEVPELSPGFRAKTIEAIEERVEKRRFPLFERTMKKVFRPYYLKLPIGGLAVAAMVLLAITIYKGFIPELDRAQRDFIISTKYVEAKSPIIIETKDVKEAFNQFKQIIQTHQGSLVRRRPIEGGKEVTFKVGKENEEKLLNDLIQLGKMKRENKGYKDGDGNIVLILKRSK